MSRRAPIRALLSLALVAAAFGAGCSGDGDGGGTPDELCAVLGDGRAYTALFEQGFDPTDAQRANAQLAAARVDLEQLRKAAPEEVRDEIDAEAAYLQAIADVLATIDPDDPAAVVAAINDLGEERAAAEVASLALRAYTDANCA